MAVRTGSMRSPARRRPPTVAAVAFLVAGAALVGCAEAPAAAVPAGPEVAAPDDPVAYQARLTRLDDELGAALTRIGQTRDPDDLEQATLAGAALVSAAGERLGTATVDEPIRRAHEALTAGLDQFGRELAFLSQRVHDHEICTGPTALAAIGSAPSMPALRAIASGLGLPGADGRTYRWGTALPPEQAAGPPVVALSNGTLLVDRRPGGEAAEGVLAVVNEGQQDVVVVLGRSGAVVVSVAASAGASTRVAGIPDGAYDLAYTAGRDWDPGLSAFARDCRFRRFSEPITFATVPVAEGTEFTVRTVNVRPGPPDATTVEVPAREMPR
ncbi:MAG: hypothetical protein ACT4O0_16415 [Pseudonocardia sp.]